MRISNNQPFVNLRSGQARGLLSNEVCSFLGLPYAVRQTPDSRLSNVKTPIAWNDVHDATVPGPVFPQFRSRLAGVMGDAINANSQSEDAFVVNVWTPENARDLPVFFFIHGGGFLSGGGSAPWYDGERIAREEQIVVVTVNYRLGVLGHYTPDGLPQDANRAVRDLLMALQWVQENISEFGGDPSKVTAGGQSAGAWYSWLLGLCPSARGLLHQNLLLSLPLVPPMNAELTQSNCRALKQIIGARDFDSLSTDEVLQAQLEMLKPLARFGDVTVGFRPAIDNELVHDHFFDFEQAAMHVHVSRTMLGSTGEENASFFYQANDVLQANEETALAWYATHYGDKAQQQYAHFASKRTSHTPYTQIIDASTDMQYTQAVTGIGEAYARSGREAYAYQFNVPSRVPHLMSPHCMELPFLFGNRKSWADAPMVAQVPEEIFERVGHDFRQAVGSFVRNGKPASSGHAWPAYTQGQPLITRIDESGAR